MTSAGASWSGFPSPHLSPPHFWRSGEFPAVEALALGAFRPGCAQGPRCRMGPVDAAYRVRLPTPLSLHS